MPIHISLNNLFLPKPALQPTITAGIPAPAVTAEIKILIRKFPQTTLKLLKKLTSAKSESCCSVAGNSKEIAASLTDCYIKTKF